MSTSSLYSDMPSSTAGYSGNSIGYFTNPQPTNYSSMFGGVPGQLAVPPSIQQELNANVPGFSNMTGAATSAVSSELAGQLSPSTMMNIGNYAASRGVAMGQPNSPLMNEIGLSTTGNTSENLVSQGIGHYNQLSSTLGSMQTDPNLVASIEQQNAVDAASPDPQKAAWYQQALMAAMINEQKQVPTDTRISQMLGSMAGMMGGMGKGMTGGMG